MNTLAEIEQEAFYRDGRIHILREGGVLVELGELAQGGGQVDPPTRGRGCASEGTPVWGGISGRVPEAGLRAHPGDEGQAGAPLRRAQDTRPGEAGGPRLPSAGHRQGPGRRLGASIVLPGGGA